ncbi:phage portal protein [Phascolarctobacterium sp.]|uniref:phage portal protein n=1 Tax=Phascolarctobacterium sp. TaxID=2049039 RepID=UPI003870CA52
MLKRVDEYPNYSGYIAAIREGGITEELVTKIIDKHRNNANYTEELYNRYKTREDAVPIFTRDARFKHDDPEIEELNNKVNNDFFGEITDIAVGYFAGKAAAYKYIDTDNEEEESTAATEQAKKALADFVTRNNMYDVNMETTKYATICGYSGRLFYIDEDGNERVMPVAPYETIILFENEMTEPFAAIRYYKTVDIYDTESYKAEYYDSSTIKFYEGQLGSLRYLEGKDKLHCFDYCPLQGIPRNREFLGDAVKVLAEIDDYDKTMSDNSNDIEGNTNAHMVFQNVVIDDTEMAKARKSGAFRFNSMGTDSKVYYLVKDVNDTFNAHHLDRLEDNIYRFSKTPNLNSDKFHEASGISLKFKITGLESKSGAFEAKCISADTYMYKLLASSFNKKRIPFDPLQAYTAYKRNFPMDLISEAQTVQGLINAGVPKKVAYEQLSFVDDVDYLMDLIEEEKEAIPSLMQNLPEDDLDDDLDDEKDQTEE